MQDGNGWALVETQEALDALVGRLAEAERIAIDTESNSLHAYRERVCLVQITIPAGDYIIDPLAVADLSPLGPILADPKIEKVFHAANYDLIVLQRDYGFRCRNLFDTMWAARILGWAHAGLGYLLEDFFGVHPQKKYQRYNWGRRPLKPEVLAYARMDTHYLLTLRDIQAEALRHQGRWEEAREVFDYLCRYVPTPRPHHPDRTFWRIKGRQELSEEEQGVLYRLHLWREMMAERRDLPPFKVLDDRRLVRLATVRPTSVEAMVEEGILTVKQAERYGKRLVYLLKAGPLSLPPSPACEPRPPEAVLQRYQRLKRWRKRLAQRRGVEPDVILPNASLWNLAWEPPRRLADLQERPGFGPWRRKHYGPMLLRLLAG